MNTYALMLHNTGVGRVGKYPWLLVYKA